MAKKSDLQSTCCRNKSDDLWRSRGMCSLRMVPLHSVALPLRGVSPSRGLQPSRMLQGHLMPHFPLRYFFSPDKDALCIFNDFATCINRICQTFTSQGKKKKHKRSLRAKLTFLEVLVLTFVDIIGLLKTNWNIGYLWRMRYKLSTSWKWNHIWVGSFWLTLLVITLDTRRMGAWSGSLSASWAPALKIWRCHQLSHLHHLHLHPKLSNYEMQLHMGTLHELQMNSKRNQTQLQMRSKLQYMSMFADRLISLEEEVSKLAARQLRLLASKSTSRG